MPRIVGPMSLRTVFVPGFENSRLSGTTPSLNPFLTMNGNWKTACAIPPRSTPTAIARAGFSMNGARRYVHPMMIMLKRIGVKPEGEKLDAVEESLKKAAMEITARWGNMIRVSSTVSDVAVPKNGMMSGVMAMPTTTVIVVTKDRNVKVAETNSSVSFFPF